MQTIHLIGNAHLDPVWLWQWPQGLAEIKATYQSALDRMDEDPEFIFTTACAAYHAWVGGQLPRDVRAYPPAGGRGSLAHRGRLVDPARL